MKDLPFKQQKIINKKAITILNIFAPFLMGCMIDLYVPSLPVITNFFHTTQQLVQFSIAIYMLGYAAGQITLGVLADCYGRRKLILLSILLFILASFFAAFSNNIYQFNFCRLLQGIAASGLVLCRAITKDIFSGLELTKAINAISISWALGPIIGPFIGSYLQHFFGWQATFFFFTIYSIALFLFFYVYIPETHFKLLRFNLREISKIFIAATHNKFFLYLSILLALNYSLSVIFNTIGPFIIEDVLKYSVIEYGYIALIIGIGYFAGNIFNRILINFLSPIKVAFIGIIGGLSVNTIFLGLSLFYRPTLLLILVPILGLFIFSGPIFSNIAGWILNKLKSNIGIMTSIMGTIQITGVTIASSGTTLLKTTSMFPLAISYFSISLIMLILFLVGMKLDKNKNPNN